MSFSFLCWSERWAGFGGCDLIRILFVLLLRSLAAAAHLIDPINIALFGPFCSLSLWFILWLFIMLFDQVSNSNNIMQIISTCFIMLTTMTALNTNFLNTN